MLLLPHTTLHPYIPDCKSSLDKHKNPQPQPVSPTTGRGLREIVGQSIVYRFILQTANDHMPLLG